MRGPVKNLQRVSSKFLAGSVHSRGAYLATKRFSELLNTRTRRKWYMGEISYHSVRACNLSWKREKDAGSAESACESEALVAKRTKVRLKYFIGRHVQPSGQTARTHLRKWQLVRFRVRYISPQSRATRILRTSRVSSGIVWECEAFWRTPDCSDALPVLVCGLRNEGGNGVVQLMV